MEKKEIKQIISLVKTNYDEAVIKTKTLSFEDQCDVILYAIDNKYDYQEDEKNDLKKNKDVIKFCREFKDVCKHILKETKDYLIPLSEMKQIIKDHRKVKEKAENCHNRHCLDPQKKLSGK